MDGLIATNTGDSGDSIHTSALGFTQPGDNLNQQLFVTMLS